MKKNERTRCEPVCGVSATFGYAPQAVSTIGVAENVPFNQVVANTSMKCCRPDIKLNIGTGDIFIREEGVYLFALHIDVPPAVNQYVTIDTGNGLSAIVSLYNGIAGTVCLPVRACSVVKVVNRGTVPLVFTPGTNLSVPLGEICIVKIR